MGPVKRTGRFLMRLTTEINTRSLDPTQIKSSLELVGKKIFSEAEINIGTESSSLFSKIIGQTFRRFQTQSETVVAIIYTEMICLTLKDVPGKR